MAGDTNLKVSETDLMGLISDYVFTGKYAQYLPEVERRETPDEAVDRIFTMHQNKFSFLSPEDMAEVRWAFDMVKAHRVYPSMRSFQFGGKAIEAKNLKLYNCSMGHIASLRSFSEVFYLLLCGCGVGYSLMPKFIDQLPELISVSDLVGETYIHVIEDSIEGWADCIEILLKSFTVGNELTGKMVLFDSSQVRPEGAPIRTGGGKAPGPAGLDSAMSAVRALLTGLVMDGHAKIRPIDALDIICHTSDAVLSGGVRRSATLGIFDRHDTEMLNAKVGDWFDTNPQRARANITVGLPRHEVELDEFVQILKLTREWGEPGFAFIENEDVVINPCAEITAIPITEDGRYGFQMCNLTTIVAHNNHSEAEFLEAAKAAAIIGTLQAAYTDFEYLNPAAKEITEDEALLGVSMTGMMDNPMLAFDKDVQRDGAQIVVETNKEWAAKIGINQSARPTAIKPEGTSTLFGGSMASGIHASHSRVMWRRVQANRSENVFNYFAEYNPHLIEKSVWSAGGTDFVIRFPIKVPDDAIVKEDLSAIDHLQMILSTQRNWVASGTTEVNRKPITHNVSCTVTVKPDEWAEVAHYIFTNRQDFAAVSLLPDGGDKKYVQAPMQAVTSDEEYAEWLEAANNIFRIDYRYMVESTDNTKFSGTVSCAGAACEII